MQLHRKFQDDYNKGRLREKEEEAMGSVEIEELLLLLWGRSSQAV